MAGSTFSTTAKALITASLRKIGLVYSHTPIAYRKHLVPALEELNFLVKAWHNDGLKLWKTENIRLSLIAHKSRYVLGTYASGVTSVKKATALIASAASGATTINVKGVTTDFTVADPLDIHQSTGTVHSTTITVIASTTGGVTLTLAAALTAACANEAQVEVYRTEVRKPIKLRQAYLVQGSTDTTTASDLELTIMSRQEYLSQNNKKSDSSVSHVYYEPKAAEGHLYVWPESSSATDKLALVVELPVDNFDSLTDAPDFPQEWYLALVYGLAEILADNYEISADKRMILAAKAQELKEAARSFDDEVGSLFIAPDFSGGGGFHHGY